MEIGTRKLQIADESAIGEARRVAVAIATGMGMGAVDAGRAAIVATELARNVLKHAGGGLMLLGAFEDLGGVGVECLALDSGPGIADIAAALRDGYSTAGTSGTGLGAVRRLSHDFDHYSRPGKGTAFLARVRPGEPRGGEVARVFSWGGLSLAKLGEHASGDGWRVKAQAEDLSVFVVDGLGHGPIAAEAARAALRVYDADRGRADTEMMARLHQALRPTRGAAASILRLQSGVDEVSFIGVGNVLGFVASDLDTRRMVNFNGTLGHALKTVRAFNHPTRGATLAVLASDGLGTHWSLDSYPGLVTRHPALIAAVLLRDFDRGRDDVTVVVARRR
jgi:anti-sigma regulatory factor (Ser/Thr protein kinase)